MFGTISFVEFVKPGAGGLQALLDGERRLGAAAVVPVRSGRGGTMGVR